MTISTQQCASHVVPGCGSTPPTGRFSWQKKNKNEAFGMLTDLNQHNRPQRPTDIKRYTGLMNNNQWNWNNPDPICISRPNAKGERKLLNGQHRLMAFFESNLEEAWFPIIEDIDESIFETMDQGIPRSASDFLNAQNQVKSGDLAPDGETLLSSHNKHIISIVNCMSRFSANMGVPNTRVEQAKMAGKYSRIVDPIISLIHVRAGRRGNDAYSTPVVAAFANAAIRYGLSNILPLAKRYSTERWADQGGKDDPLKVLHQLIRAYNAKDKMIKKKLNTQKVMYSYAVSAIRTALSHPDHWTERLLPTRTASEFGDNPQWETRIRQNITIQPESI